MTDRRTYGDPCGIARALDLVGERRALRPVRIAPGRWGSRAPLPPGGAGLGVDAFVVALKTLFDPSAAAGFSASVELRVDAQKFHARVSGKRLELLRETAKRPDAMVEGDTRSLSAVMWRGRRLPEAPRARGIQGEGA